MSKEMALPHWVMRCVLCLAGLLSAGSTAASWDCDEASALRADADDASRRIACTIPEAYRHDVLMAEWAGRTIRLHDIAAWLTTDALVAIDAMEGMAGKGRGWLTLDDGTGNVELRYFGEEDGDVRAFAAATLRLEPFGVSGQRRLRPAEPMTAREQRLMRAKALVLESGQGFVCTDHPPNTVVFEAVDQGLDEILVFVMSAFDDEEAPKAPTMFHVFLGLQYRKPIYVTTDQNDLVWLVDEGQIALVATDASTFDVVAHMESSR